MGKAYWAATAVIGLGALAASAAFAGPDEQATAAQPDAVRPSSVQPAPKRLDETAAVERCFSNVQERLAARGAAAVTLAALNRAWPGSEGWIVDVSVDVAREDGRARRQAFTCRQGRHGLHVARG